MARVALGTYARRRGVDEAAIRYQARRGIIDRAPDGSVSVQQADDAWFGPHQARLGQQARRAETDNRLMRARIAAVVAKTQLARLKLNELAASLVDRAEAVAEVDAEIALLLARLHALPTEPLIALGLAPEAARRLLDDFLHQTLVGLADVAEPIAPETGSIHRASG